MGMAELQVSIEQSSLGLALVAGTAAGVCAALLGEDGEALRRDVERRFRGSRLVEADEAFRRQALAVVSFIEGRVPVCDVPLDLRGTPFQRRVWEALREIPTGTTTSYRELAARVGRPQAVRAVGQAVGANPIAVLVPCHRAIRSDGSLSGYRWGAERKRQLLDREAS